MSQQPDNSSSNPTPAVTRNDDEDALSTLPPTDMLYLTYDGNFQTVCESQILNVVVVSQPAVVEPSQAAAGNEECFTNNNNTIVSIVLDQTVLHAQGGGQPTDIGTLKKIGTSNAEDCDDDEGAVILQVFKVLMDRSTGVAVHTGTVATTTSKNAAADDEAAALSLSSSSFFQVGDRVQVSVNVETRRILSECHTAGHVVDSAMARCGMMMKPIKGYHFLEGPYVEYEGSIPPDQRDTLLDQLQTAFCALVDENMDTEIALMSRQEAHALCNRGENSSTSNFFDMDVFADPRTDQVRVVTVAGYPCPCGGTHVRSTGELADQQWQITGLKAKKGVVRVKYGRGATTHGKKIK